MVCRIFHFKTNSNVHDTKQNNNKKNNYNLSIGYLTLNIVLSQIEILGI